MNREKIKALDALFRRLLFLRFPEFKDAKCNHRYQSKSTKSILSYLKFTLKLDKQTGRTVLLHRDWSDDLGYIFNFEFGEHDLEDGVGEMSLKSLANLESCIEDKTERKNFILMYWGADWFRLGMELSDVEHNLHYIFDLYEAFLERERKKAQRRRKKSRAQHHPIKKDSN